MEQDVVITVKVPEALRDEIDRRVAGLDLNRSQYFRRLVREDIESAKAPTTDTKEGGQ